MKEYRISVTKYANNKEVENVKLYDFTNKKLALYAAKTICKNMHDYKENINTYYLVYFWDSITHESKEVFAGELYAKYKRFIFDSSPADKYLYN